MTSEHDDGIGTEKGPKMTSPSAAQAPPIGHGASIEDATPEPRASRSRAGRSLSGARAASTGAILVAAGLAIAAVLILR